MNELDIQEIQNDVRREQYQKIWKRYGRQVSLAVALLLLGVGGYQAYSAYQLKQNHRASELFAKADQLLGEQKRQEAMDILSQLSHDSSAGAFAALAAMREGTLQVDGGDVDKAIERLVALGKDQSVEPSLRELAHLVAAYYALSQNDQDDVEKDALAYAGSRDSVYPGLWREWLAMAAYKEGRMGDARNILSELAVDAEVAPGIKERAAQLASILPEEPAKAEPAEATEAP
jgi:hypothetical protein